MYMVCMLLRAKMNITFRRAKRTWNATLSSLISRHKVSTGHDPGGNYEKRITRGTKERHSFMAFTAPELPRHTKKRSKDWQIAMDKWMGSGLENKTWNEAPNTEQRALNCK